MTSTTSNTNEDIHARLADTLSERVLAVNGRMSPHEISNLCGVSVEDLNKHNEDGMDLYEWLVVTLCSTWMKRLDTIMATAKNVDEFIQILQSPAGTAAYNLTNALTLKLKECADSPPTVESLYQRLPLDLLMQPQLKRLMKGMGEDEAVTAMIRIMATLTLQLGPDYWISVLAQPEIPMSIENLRTRLVSG